MSVTEDYLRQKREQAEDTRLKLADTVNHDADRAARLFKASAFTGLPEDVIDADLDNIEERVRQNNFDPERYRKNSPAFASFAAENPYHLSVLKDDLESMSGIERAWAPIAMGWDSGWATVELGRIRARHIDGDVREGDDERLKELRKSMQPHEFGAGGGFAKFLVKNAKMMPMTFASMGEGLQLGLGGASIGAAAGTVAGPGAPITVPAAAGIGFTTGMITGTSQAAFNLERGFAYDEYLEMGLDQQSARYAANTVGVVNAAFETFGISQAVKYVPGFNAAKGAAAKQLVNEVLVKPSFKRASGIYVARFGEVLGSEVITEVLQESATVIGGELIKGDQDVAMTWDEYVDRVAEIAAETMQGAFIMSSFGPTATYIQDSRAAYSAKNMELVYKSLGESAEDSTTRKDVPSKYREFVERMTKNGPIKSLLIDVDRFTTYFQEIGQDPNEVAKELGIDMDEATAAGTDLEIPIDAYAEKIAPTEHHAALARDLKSDSEQMTAREAEEWYKNADEIEKVLAGEIEPEGHKAVQEIYDTVLGENLAADIEYSAAENNAAVTEFVFSTLAERNNMDPLELFNKYWGGVRKDLPEVLQKKDVDVLIDPLLNMLREGQGPTQRDIFGESLVDFLRSKGGMQDVGGELSAMDVSEVFTGKNALLWKDMTPAQKRKAKKEGGMTIDEAAELAAEAGFILERDEAQLLAAIDRETRGDPVHGRGADPEVTDTARALEQLGGFIEAEGINLDEMTNAEIRQRLAAGTTYEQAKVVSSKEQQLEVEEILELAVAAVEHDEGMLSRALASMPNVADQQDFSGQEFTDTVRIKETGETVEVTESAQKTFDKAVKRRKVLKKLMDCVSGS